MGLGDVAKAEAKARRGRKPAPVVYDDDTLAMYNPRTWGQEDRDTSKPQFIAPEKTSVKGAKYTDDDISEEGELRRDKAYRRGRGRWPFAKTKHLKFTARNAGDALANDMED